MVLRVRRERVRRVRVRRVRMRQGWRWRWRWRPQVRRWRWVPQLRQHGLWDRRAHRQVAERRMVGRRWAGRGWGGSSSLEAGDPHLVLIVLNQRLLVQPVVVCRL